MTTSNPNGPTTAEKRAYCRKAIALYLVEIADQIDKGAIDAFDLQWDHQAEILRPIGSVVFDATFVRTTLPHEVAPPEPPKPKTINLSAVREKIPVEDLSSNIRDLKPCTDPECPNCSKKG